VPAVPVRDLVLEGVIAHEQVEVLFQPQIDVRTGSVIGAEALARSPIANADVLFARAGAAALGERLSRLIQRKALRCAAAWEGPLRALKLSINLLPADICRNGFEQWLLDEIMVAGLDPARITVEITETALLEDQRLVASRLSRLRESGISIAVDDFGTGYASLAYLTSLPLDMLKIDKGLLGGIVDGARDRIVVEAMIRLARELNLKVVAEGVETAEQLALVAEWGCDLYQGFLGAGPLSHEELTRFVAATRAEAA
jgi:EAL domain-containing protein (putative c-di-GMP-specific phosphodiesterase class I)